MGYKPIEVDRKKHTIMGVDFPDLSTLEKVSSAIGSNMFEGFEPTPQLIKLYRDYSSGKIPPKDLLDHLRRVV
jgi:putative transcriptional regulator